MVGMGTGMGMGMGMLVGAGRRALREKKVLIIHHLF